jgi:hypothetical protein
MSAGKQVPVLKVSGEPLESGRMRASERSQAQNGTAIVCVSTSTVDPRDRN